MDPLSVILALMPSVLRIVEGLFSKEPKSGPKKKEAAMSGLAGFAKGMEMVSTGGQKETWNGINKNMGRIGAIIDQTVTTLNAVGLLDNPFDDDHNN